MEGLWRWQIKGRPVWLMQLWATEGNGAVGEGMLMLMSGDVEGEPKSGGRAVDLSKPLEAFWSGQYGSSDHQSQIKPQVYLDRYLVLASVAAATAAVYDLDNGSVVGMVKNLPQAELVEDVVLSTDARHIIQVNSDGQFFIHDVTSGRTALSGRVVDDEFIVYTAEGYYWSSYEGAHFVQIKFPGMPSLFPFQQFAGVLDHGDIVKAQLRTGAKPPAAPKLVPPPSLDVAITGQSSGDQVGLHFAARGTAPLQHLRLFADGQLVGDTALAGTDASGDIAVPEASGARWITAQASDAKAWCRRPSRSA